MAGKNRTEVPTEKKRTDRETRVQRRQQRHLWRSAVLALLIHVPVDLGCVVHRETGLLRREVGNDSCLPQRKKPHERNRERSFHPTWHRVRSRFVLA